MGTIIQFFKESWSEIKKVSWPKGPELVKHTIMVSVVIVVFAAITALIDYGMKTGFEMLPTPSVAPASQNLPISPEDIQVQTTPATSTGSVAK